MKKKIIALCLIVALAITAVTGATLAYFTDIADDVNNTFAIGNIEINLTEEAKVLDKDGNEVDGALEENKKGGYDYNNLMPTYELVKKPTVTNTGDFTAYVRVAVVMNNVSAINEAIDEVYENLDTPYTADQIQAVYDEVFDGWGVQYGKHDDEGVPYGRRMWMMTREAQHRPDYANSPVLCNIDTFVINEKSETSIWGGRDVWAAFATEVEREEENGDGSWNSSTDTGYADYYYYDAINADERIYVFYLELDAGEEYTLFDGLNVPADFNAEQMKMFEGLEIGVYADAIQTAGFDTYTDAFNALEAEHPLGWWN